MKFEYSKFRRGNHFDTCCMQLAKSLLFIFPFLCWVWDIMWYIADGFLTGLPPKRLSYPKKDWREKDHTHTQKQWIEVFFLLPKRQISIFGQPNNFSPTHHPCWFEWSKDINQIFDILPIMGTLEPGHTQESGHTQVSCREYGCWTIILVVVLSVVHSMCIRILQNFMDVSKRNALPFYFS